MKSEKFFAQDVVFLPGPFLFQEFANGGMASEELGAVAPDRVRCVGGEDGGWRAGVPEGLGGFDLLLSGLKSKGGDGGSRWHDCGSGSKLWRY